MGGEVEAYGFVFRGPAWKFIGVATGLGLRAGRLG